MSWTVLFHEAFDAEFAALDLDVQDELLAHTEVLAGFGPSLGRPHVDTLAGSRHRNMKELRFRTRHGVWRAAFAFDPLRRAIVLVAGAKGGIAQDRFYRMMIRTADARFTEWLDRLPTRTEED